MNLNERSVRSAYGVEMAVKHGENGRKSIPTLVKDSSLVESKRRTIVDAAVGLFVRKGYHETTTREIAREAGFSIGSLYEYVQSKEDVLYLVCDAIHAEMESRLREALQEGDDGAETLREAIARFVEVCDRMQDTILLIYRETASLSEESRRYVLQNEARITEIFVSIIERGLEDGSLSVDDPSAIPLAAHTIAVLGHTWAFRRWALRSRYSLEEFIAQQTALVMGPLISNAEVGS